MNAFCFRETTVDIIISLMSLSNKMIEVANLYITSQPKELIRQEHRPSRFVNEYTEETLKSSDNITSLTIHVSFPTSYSMLESCKKKLICSTKCHDLHGIQDMCDTGSQYGT